MKKGTLYHPKTQQLAKLLNRTISEAAGYLQALWIVTGEYCPQSNIGKFPDAWIAEAIHWPGPHHDLISALLETRWLDEDQDHRLLVHDFWDHCEDSVHCKLARHTQYFYTRFGPKIPKLHKFAERTKSGDTPREDILQAFRELESGQLALPLEAPKPRPPKAARPPRNTGDQWAKPLQRAAFIQFFTTYPNQVAETPAWREWQKTVKSQALAEEIHAALYKQLETNHLGDDPTYIPKPNNWLKDQRWKDQLRAPAKARRTDKDDPYEMAEPTPEQIALAASFTQEITDGNR